MAKTRLQKEQHAQAIKASLAKANGVFVAEYKGATAEDLFELRNNLRSVESDFVVVKNRVALKGVSEESQGSLLGEFLTGPVGLAFANADAAAAAKKIISYAKTNDKIVVKGGVVDGDKLEAQQIKALSLLPSKEVLLAQALSTLVSPHRGLMLTVNGVASNLVRVINSIAEKNNK
jgi:large subunit ribosomal protein L10